ncbi:hypothetical protein PV328_007438 [Microctonus aethiopoides]|uniref:Phosphoglycolate phosphatase n=1 Tax=Microctonus aethiopoides TaxID=144406 RepID=A0AA39C945_9HYME|nr:hypothetical protein PV328_007438 [Microctonus aethiopoides]
MKELFSNLLRKSKHNFFYRKMATINLKSLKEDEINEFINSFDTVLSDCDGVLWNKNDSIPHAADTLNAFTQLGKRVFFVTNNSTKTRDEFVKKCHMLNFIATKDSIVSTAYLVAQYLQDIKFNKKVYLIGSSGIAQELDRVGIGHIGLGPEGIISEDFDFSHIKCDPEVGAVVVGFDLHFNYLKVLKAASYLNNKDIMFIATNTDEQFPAGTNIIIPGTGSLVKCVETCAERQPIIMGKPSPYAAKMLENNYQINPKRTLMIGDRANTDILFGKRCGFKTLLVLTGCTQLTQLEKWKSSGEPKDHELLPDFYTNTIGDILPYIKN